MLLWNLRRNFFIIFFLKNCSGILLTNSVDENFQYFSPWIPVNCFKIVAYLFVADFNVTPLILPLFVSTMRSSDMIASQRLRKTIRMSAELCITDCSWFHWRRYWGRVLLRTHSVFLTSIIKSWNQEKK